MVRHLFICLKFPATPINSCQTEEKAPHFTIRPLPSQKKNLSSIIVFLHVCFRENVCGRIGQNGAPTRSHSNDDATAAQRCTGSISLVTIGRKRQRLWHSVSNIHILRALTTTQGQFVHLKVNIIKQLNYKSSPFLFHNKIYT